MIAAGVECCLFSNCFMSTNSSCQTFMLDLILQLFYCIIVTFVWSVKALLTITHSQINTNLIERHVVLDEIHDLVDVLIHKCYTFSGMHQVTNFLQCLTNLILWKRKFRSDLRMYTGYFYLLLWLCLNGTYTFEVDININIWAEFIVSNSVREGIIDSCIPK